MELTGQSRHVETETHATRAKALWPWIGLAYFLAFATAVGLLCVWFSNIGGPDSGFPPYYEPGKMYAALGLLAINLAGCILAFIVICRALRAHRGFVADIAFLAGLINAGVMVLGLATVLNQLTLRWHSSL